jgi:hypothetical protein
MENTIFPEVVNQIKKHNETLQDVAEVLGLNYASQITRRLRGEVEWTIGDVEILCKHYDMDFWELFKRKEN